MDATTSLTNTGMHKSISVAMLISLAFVVAACAVTSDIQKVSESESHFEDAVYEGRDYYIAEEKVEGEQYRVFHQASTGFSGTSGIRQTATLRAQKFCKEMDGDKVMFKVSEHTASPPYILGNFPRIEIIFVCVERELPDPVVVDNSDKYDQLERIKSLYDDGALTKEEFDQEKKEILSR